MAISLLLAGDIIVISLILGKDIFESDIITARVYMNVISLIPDKKCD